jgi:hypothetical protein
MGARGDFFVSEGGDAMILLDGMFVGRPRMLQALTRALLPGQVILFPVLLVRGAMGMRGGVVEFGGALVIFVMGSVVKACGHRLKGHDLAGLGVGFLG